MRKPESGTVASVAGIRWWMLDSKKIKELLLLVTGNRTRREDVDSLSWNAEGEENPMRDSGVSYHAWLQPPGVFRDIPWRNI